MLNFRPISILPQISKYFEKIIKFRLVNFLNKYSIIDKSQYGFRKNMSTGDALADVIETINDHLQNLKKCSVVSIDLKKAFDTVDHNILFKKLDHYGIRCITLDLFKSYISDRYQCIEFDSVLSDLKKSKLWYSTRFCFRAKFIYFIY